MFRIIINWVSHNLPFARSKFNSPDKSNCKISNCSNSNLKFRITHEIYSRTKLPLTNHHIATNAGKTGIRDVTIPLIRVKRENTRIALFLPQISDTIPATKVPIANPEKKIILAMVGR